MPSAIDPTQIPGKDLDPDAVEANASTIGAIAGQVRDNGSNVHLKWQGMASVYEAPESGTLLGLMQPVSSQATTAGDNLETVSGALQQFAAEVRPIKAELDSLRLQAEAFRAEIGGGVSVRELNPAFINAQGYSGSWNAYGAANTTETADIPQYRTVTKEWHEVQEYVDRNNDLIAQVNAQQVALWDAERSAANKIRALYGASPLHAYESENDALGYGLSEIPEGTEMPWGAPVERSEGCGEATFNFVVKDFLWEGILVGGVWGTVQGLGTLVLGYNPATGEWFSGDAYGAAWGGLGLLVASGVMNSPLLGPILWADQGLEAFGGGGFLPQEVRDFKAQADEAAMNTGKSLIAWDKWADDPGTALGESVFNVGTILIPAGAAITGVKTAGTAASVLSKMARVVDLIDPASLAVGGAVRLGGVGLGSIDNLLGGLDLGAKLDPPHIEIYAAPDSASAIRTLDDWGVDLGTVTARVDDLGTPVLEAPGIRIEMPAGSFDGAGAIRGTDGGMDAGIPAPVREPELVAAGGVRGETGPGAVNSIVDEAPVRTETGGSGESTVIREPENTIGVGDSGNGGSGDSGHGFGGPEDRAPLGEDGPGAGTPSDAPGTSVVDPYEHVGPAEIDPAQPGAHLVPESYDRFGDLTPEEFLDRHWDPTKVNSWDGSTGGWVYPPDEGFDLTPGTPSPRSVDLPEGYRFDRFGGEGGEYVSPEGTLFPERALPPDSLDKPYHVYEVIRPFDEGSGLPVAGRIVEAFEQPGGGIQFKLPQTVQWLLDSGYIKEVRP